jgi:Raf kinase inhibitor-like YbhB/YbcL family protein
MSTIRKLTIGAALFAAACSGALAQPAPGTAPPRPAFTLSSSVIQMDQVIPEKYAGTAGITPPLSWTNTPAGTQSFTLLLHDLEPAIDHGTGDVTHWLMFNIPGTATALPENISPASAQLPDGSIQAKNRAGRPGFIGPGAPPPNYHHYVFELYALDTRLNLGADASRAQIMAAMEGHVNGKAVLVSRYHR